LTNLTINMANPFTSSTVNVMCLLVQIPRRFEGWSIVVSGDSETASEARAATASAIKQMQQQQQQQQQQQRVPLLVQRCHSLGSAVRNVFSWKKADLSKKPPLVRFSQHHSGPRPSTKALQLIVAGLRVSLTVTLSCTQKKA
jgi:hypothetical protein